MIKKLHRQLTALFTAATGLILTLVVIGGLVVSARELEKKSLEAFQNDVLGITSRLQSGATISCTWLSQLESSRRLIIHIEDNGVPLLYSGSWSPLTDRNLLIERTREMALAQHIDPSVSPVSSSLLRSPVYTVEGSRKDSYLGCVLVLPVGNSFQSLTLLAYKGPASSGLYRQGFLFLLLNLAGIGALMAVSWILVGKALKPLKENQQKQNEFIAAASHELRAPLAVIRSSISAARSMPRDCEQFMDNMDKECCRMSYLVGDMLLLASADAGHWVIRMAPLDMDTLLIDMYERFEPLYQDKGVALHLELPQSSLPRINGDGKRLEQILSILLDNALRYTPKNGSVRLSACVEQVSHLLSGTKKSLCLTVSDQGCGIDDNAKKHIFDRFYQADSSRSDKQHYGLGLSIAKELVQKHGGTISVGDSPSGGACFMVCLPVM